MEHPDQRYIDRVLNGDHRAFAHLVEAYKHMAYTIARRLTGNEADAEDVAQESFVKAYRQLHTFEGKAKFSTWLYTIVYRTAVTKMQEKRPDAFALADDVSENEAHDPSAAPVDQLQARDEQRHVREAIQRLPKTDALLITLYYLEEHSVKEIQDITGLTAENIKVRLFRSRKKLEQWLSFLL